VAPSRNQGMDPGRIWRIPEANCMGFGLGRPRKSLEEMSMRVRLFVSKFFWGVACTRREQPPRSSGALLIPDE
jgi:hypothetical protein